MLMKTREYVDFEVIEPHHQEMDRRLTNWGRSCYSGGGGGANGVFKWVKPSQTWDEIETRIPVDRHDAMLIAKGVAALPNLHGRALNWCYVRRTSPNDGCRLCGTTMKGLAQLIRDGRTMLINRGV